jgi:hypothetical protein
MIQMSNVPEDELFKICLDFWHFLSVDIMQNPRNNKEQAAVVGMNFF